MYRTETSCNLEEQQTQQGGDTRGLVDMEGEKRLRLCDRASVLPRCPAGRPGRSAHLCFSLLSRRAQMLDFVSSLCCGSAAV